MDALLRCSERVKVPILVSIVPHANARKIQKDVCDIHSYATLCTPMRSVLEALCLYWGNAMRNGPASTDRMHLW